VGDVRLVDVRATPLSVDEVLTAVRDRRAGGVALFLGVVRTNDHGREVAGLEYEAHPRALDAMREIAEAIAAQPEVLAVAAVHRVGALEIGDYAVLTAAACAHRHDAFRAGQDLIDGIKERVPIWKRQTFLDGDVEWVGIDDAAG
jgi:molybdopterin synthase catalytic subunit